MLLLHKSIFSASKELLVPLQKGHYLSCFHCCSKKKYKLDKLYFQRVCFPPFAYVPWGIFCSLEMSLVVGLKPKQRVRLTWQMALMLSGSARCQLWFPHSTCWARLSLLLADTAITWGRARRQPMKCRANTPNIPADGKAGTESRLCLGVQLGSWQAGTALARQAVPL